MLIGTVFQVLFVELNLWDFEFCRILCHFGLIIGRSVLIFGHFGLIIGRSALIFGHFGLIIGRSVLIFGHFG